MAAHSGTRIARRATVLALLALAPAGTVAQAAQPPSPWDGRKPFRCKVQEAAFGATGPHPGRDPYCVHFDKTRQNLTELGVVDFLSKEPARIAAASDKCFYFQKDHWRASVVQNVPATKTYEWRGHYFFDKARGEGGVWVTEFSLNGQTSDPRDLPGFPAEYEPFFGPGEGGVITHNDVDADPRCVARAQRRGDQIYRGHQREADRSHQRSRDRSQRAPADEPGEPVLDGVLGSLHLG